MISDNHEDIVDLINVLDANLREADPVGTSTHFQKLKTVFGNSLDNSEAGALLIELEREVNRYNFDRARDILNAFAGELKMILSLKGTLTVSTPRHAKHAGDAAVTAKAATSGSPAMKSKPSPPAFPWKPRHSSGST